MRHLAVNLKAVHTYSKFDFVIFHDGFSEGDAQALMEVAGDIVKLKLWRQQDFEETFGLSLLSDDVNFSRFIQRFSYMALSKPMMFSLLSEYKKVLLLDIDTLVLRPLDELFDRKGLHWRSGQKFIEKIRTGANISSFGYGKVNSDTSIPNGGVIFASQEIPHEKMFFDAAEFIRVHHQEIDALDETSIAWAASKNSVKHEDFGSDYNAIPQAERDSTVIVHTIGGRKFWNDPLLNLLYGDWEKYYKMWRHAGGSSHNYSKTPGVFSEFRPRLFEQAVISEVWCRIIDGFEFKIPDNARISANIFRHFVPIYVRGWPKSIYFEMRIHDPVYSQRIRVSLQIRDESLLKDPKVFDAVERIIASGEGVWFKSQGERFLAVDSVFVRHSDVAEAIKQLMRAATREMQSIPLVAT